MAHFSEAGGGYQAHVARTDHADGNRLGHAQTLVCFCSRTIASGRNDDSRV
jgi:hypothetical protein